MGETSTVEALEQIATAPHSLPVPDYIKVIAREALPRARAEAEELDQLRAADAEWKADTLQEQAARIKAQAAVIEAAKAWAGSLGGNYDKKGHPGDIEALRDALDSLTTTQGDQKESRASVHRNTAL